MAKQRTNSSRFQSLYGGGWVSPAQYLTECLCILMAKTERKELQDRFWQREPWKNVFRRQVPLAVELLKEHPPEVILSVLRDRRCWKIRSFGAKWLLGPLLKEKQREYDVKKSQHKEDNKLEKTQTTQKPRRPKGENKSLLSKLG